MICPKCNHEFDRAEMRAAAGQGFWQIVAANPKHPLWIALIGVLPGVLVTAILCQRFDSDEVIKLLTWGASSGLVALAANVIKAHAAK